MMLVYHSLLFIQRYLTVIYNYLHTFWIETNFGKPFSLVREKSRWSYIAERFVKTSWTVVRPFKEYLFLSNHIWQSAMFFFHFGDKKDNLWQSFQTWITAQWLKSVTTIKWSLWSSHGRCIRNTRLLTILQYSSVLINELLNIITE